MDDYKFQNLRDQWALRSPVLSQEQLSYEYHKDQLANPHNEPYHNKKPRRDKAQIHSDRAYAFADAVLKQQYGSYYMDWLRKQGYAMDQWQDTYRLARR